MTTHCDALPRGAQRRLAGNGEARTKASFWALMLGSIGVVYGDIGTSPLYAMRESVQAAVGAGNAATEPAVLGILSLIIWALIVIVTLKYVVHPAARRQQRRGRHAGADGAGASRAVARRRGIVLLGIISGALFYGDAILTPALSVLSAVEGLKIVTPAFEPYVVPLTVVILIALFAVQSRGTAQVASVLRSDHAGLVHRSSRPPASGISARTRPCCAAFNPVYGVNFLLSHGLIGLVTLGAVFLVVTGAEALYADLGHFGASRSAWPG